MTISIINRAQNNVNGSVASLQTTISGTSGGSVLVVMGFYNTAPASITVSNSSGDSYTSGNDAVACTETTSNMFYGMFKTPTISTSSVTVTFNGSNSAYADLICWEVAGLNGPTFDKFLHDTQLSVGPGTDVNGSATGTLSASAEACFYYANCTGNLTGGASANSPWVNILELTNTGSAADEQVVSSNASIFGSIHSGGTGGSVDMFTLTVMSNATQTPTTAGFFIEDTTLQRQPQNQRMMKADPQFATPAQPLPVNQNVGNPSAAGIIKVRMIPC